MAELKCPGEREGLAFGKGTASYSAGFRLSFFGLIARVAAGDAADAALASDLQRAQALLCQGLCTPPCTCRIRLERVRFFDGYTRVSFVPRRTILGLSFGGTYTVEKAYRVFAECFRQVIEGPGGSGVPGVGDISPVPGELAPR